MERRFIEESFPIKKVSEESREEKKIRRNNVSTIHNWWARRPMSSSRASNYASLIIFKEGKKDVEEQLEFISKLSEAKRISDEDLLKIARRKILKSNNGKSPKILDPFAGSGVIPLESLRLSCDTYASDYNPVSVLILKALLEYPYKFKKTKDDSEGLHIKIVKNSLEKEVKHWSKWVLDEVKKELEQFYQKDANNPQVASIWSRTITCENPKCGVEIPLMRNFWLSTKKGKEVAVFPTIIGKKINFKLVGEKYEKMPSGFDPSQGTASRSIATCLICKSSTSSKNVRKQFTDLKSNERLIAIIFDKPHQSGKNYRIANEDDVILFKNAEKYLKQKRNEILKSQGFDPIPNEDFPRDVNMISEPLGSAQNFHFFKWGDLYNSRQKLAMMTFSEKIGLAYKKMLDLGYENDFAVAITTYLGIIHSKLADWNSTLTLWLAYMEKQGHVFSRPTLSFTTDYCENVPIANTSGSWTITTDVVLGSLKVFPKYPGKLVSIKNESAINLSYEDNYFDAVFTDPPYYDNVAYSYLSDYFYVWLKRSVGFLYPELFSTPLTPKSNEIVAYSLKIDGKETGKEKFEDLLKQSFQEIHRVLKPDGIATIVYAHKSTDGWETLIKSILKSGLVVTAAWPLHTEMEMRMTAHDTAALASSIYMICRKWEKEPIGFYRDIKKELKQYLNKKLEQLWNEGILGADFFISSISSAIEVFGKYEKIVDDGDNEVPIIKLLNDTRKISTDYAINKVIKGEFSENISQMTRFYILWRWAYGESKVPFDNALKMAQSVGIDIEHEWNKGFIKKDKEFIRVLGPDERTEKELSDSHDLIDILHNALQLWRKEKRETVEKFLEEKGYKNSEVLKRVAQAISESLPIESTEKKWLDGFLTGFKETDSKNGSQSKLF